VHHGSTKSKSVLYSGAKTSSRRNFATKKELRAKIEQFITYFNATMAKPFRWTMVQNLHGFPIFKWIFAIAISEGAGEVDAGHRNFAPNRAKPPPIRPRPDR
jgi:hypothetical protein